MLTIEPAPHFKGPRKGLGAIRSEEGTTHSGVEHRWFVADQNIQGHNRGETVVGHGGLALEEAVQLIEVDGCDLLDLDLEDGYGSVRLGDAVDAERDLVGKNHAE